MLKNNNFKIIFSIILLATLTRIAIPGFLNHPPNFSPIDAIALFCGAYFNRFFMACLIALLSVAVGDLFLGSLFYSGWYWQYGCYAAMVWMGKVAMPAEREVREVASRKYLHRVGFACISSAILFFIISNFGVWFSGVLYPFTFDGLIQCYVAAIPFFKNSLLSDLFFGFILFGATEWILKWRLSIQQSKA